MEEISNKLVEIPTRTPNIIYILNETGNGSCCLRKEDESWLWHKRMEHINFENLVNFNKNKEVR